MELWLHELAPGDSGGLIEDQCLVSLEGSEQHGGVGGARVLGGGDAEVLGLQAQRVTRDAALHAAGPRPHLVAALVVGAEVVAPLLLLPLLGAGRPGRGGTEAERESEQRQQMMHTARGLTLALALALALVRL